MDIKVHGVIGAGVMGAGVAQSLAQAGHRVVLLDLSQDVLEAAKKTIAHDVRLHALVRKKKMAAGEVEELLARIQCTTDYEALSQADYVVENVTEKWSSKLPVYERLDAVCPVHCVFAANTSALSITRIGSATARPDRVIGVHFMNPVPLKDTAEVIRGYHTSDATIQTTLSLLKSMGKSGIVVNDSPGFVSNRVLMLTVNEAIFLVQDQVAKAEDVDEVFRSCFGHPMGPLETADLIGLDTILLSLEVLYESFCDSKYRPSPLLKKMVDAGLYGRKSGQGFYKHATHG